MKRTRPSRAEILSTFRTIALEERHEGQIESSAHGRESQRLRQRGVWADSQGDWPAAHEFFARAFASFDPDDLGAGAASAGYDLAVAMINAPPWREREMLRDAENVLRRCLRSAERMAEPLRAARTYDALAQVLRRRSATPRAPEDEELLAESKTMSRRAMKIVDATGPIGWKDAACHRLTYANALNRAGDHVQAVKVTEEALDRVARYRRRAPGAMSPEQVADNVAKIQAARTTALLARGRKSDLKRVVDIAAGLRHNYSETAIQVHGNAVHALLKLDRREQARAALEEVGWNGKYASLALLGSLWRELGEPDLAAGYFRQARQMVLDERKNAAASHVADACASIMQDLAREEAEIHLQQGHQVEAFLALENCSALRYFDDVSALGWVATDPVVRSLHDRSGFVSVMAMKAQEYAALLVTLDDEEREEAAAECLSQLAQDPRGATKPVVPDSADEAAEVARDVLLTALVSAGRSPAVVGSMERFTADLLQGVERLVDAIRTLDPHAGGVGFSWSNEMSPELLQACLQEHPNTALLRVALEPTKLTAICVWLAGDEVVARSATLDLPVGTVACLLNATALDSGDPATRLEFGQFLSLLDLSAVYPDRHIEDLVILPSTFAALVPWAAAGPARNTPLDRFASISYLPMLTPMVMRQALRSRRSGTVVVMPGEACAGGATHFHELAFAQPAQDEVRLLGSEATIDAVRQAGRRSDVVSIYAHGQYHPSSGALVQLSDGDLSLTELPIEWAGCERVELWACRSGVNVSLDHLTPHVDEAFGADIAFHRSGVRSTIGTLWSVNDLVTAHIARRFRAGLAEGLSPPRALAAAQRWWRDEAVPQITDALRSMSEADARERILSLLGSDAFGLRELGPVDTQAPLSLEAREALIDTLTGTTAWAGYRFVGIANRRPVGDLPTGHDRPLTREERDKVDAVFAEALGADHELVAAFQRRRLERERLEGVEVE